MAIASTCVWEARSTATAGNANGGFFKTGASGTDYSQQDAAQYNLTGATSAGADAIILHANAAADMVGNAANVVSGTNATAGRYEIISVVAGVSITLDRNWGTGAVANGVVNIGGALSLQHSSDDAVFESFEPGNVCYVKSGTYTMAVIISISKAGTSVLPIKVIGYATTRGDAPKGSTRPLFNFGTSYNMVLGAYWQIECLAMEVNVAASLLTAIATGNVVRYCKFTQKTTTASWIALYCQGATVIGCEAICYRGSAFYFNGGMLIGCHAHSSNIGFLNSGTTAPMIINCMVSDCVTAGIDYAAIVSTNSMILGCTLYGFGSKAADGIRILTGSNSGSRIVIANNVIMNFATGINYGTAIESCVIDNNSFYNNTADVTNVTKDYGNITADPGISGVSEITGSNGTTSGSVLSSSGANFSSVVAGRDFLYLVSGTGITTGIYGITLVSGTDLTLDIAPGTSATADKVFRIITGRNFTPGVNLKSGGIPSQLLPSYTTSYVDIGAVQRQEKVYTDPLEANVRVGTAYTYADEAMVGELESNPTPSAIADAVWDALTANHADSGSFGALMQKLLTVAKFLGLK